MFKTFTHQTNKSEVKSAGNNRRNINLLYLANESCVQGFKRHLLLQRIFGMYFTGYRANVALLVDTRHILPALCLPHEMEI